MPVISSCDLGTLSGVFCHIVILKCISDLYIQASGSLASCGKTQEFSNWTGMFVIM